MLCRVNARQLNGIDRDDYIFVKGVVMSETKVEIDRASIDLLRDELLSFVQTKIEQGVCLKDASTALLEASALLYNMSKGKSHYLSDIQVLQVFAPWVVDAIIKMHHSGGFDERSLQ